MSGWAALAAAGLVLASAQTAAAAGPSEPPGMDSKAPIDITADEAEVTISKCMTIWRGSAEALQGTTRLRANVISVYAKPGAKNASGQQQCGATDRLEADGNVYFVTPTQNARGDHATYSADADQIVLTGDVIIVQGNDVARGDRLTIKVSTREAHMEAAARGAGAPHRVRGVFYPSQNQGVGQAAAAPAPAAQP